MSAKIEIQGEFVKVQEECDESYMMVHISDLSQEEKVKLAAWALQEVQVGTTRSGQWRFLNNESWVIYYGFYNKNRLYWP